MPNKSGYFIPALIALCIALYFLGIATPSFTDPDDAFYAETAKEMNAQHSILTPLIFEQPQFEKPPAYLWLLMISFKLLGVNPIAARLVSALFGMLAVIGTFLFFRKLMDEWTAFSGAAILASAVWWIGLTHVVLTDMVFSAFVSFSLYSFFLWYREEKGSYLQLFALFSALATLTKGPLGIILSLATATVFLIGMRSGRQLWKLAFGSWWFLFLVVTLPWYIYAGFKYGQAFLWEFFVNCNWNRLIRAEHPSFNTLYFYPAVIIVGFIPWTGLLPLIGNGFRRLREEYLFAFTWFVVMFVIFSAAQSKLSTYISPVFPALVMLVTLPLVEANFTKWRTRSVAAVLILCGAVLAIAPLFLQKDHPAFVGSGFLSFGPLALALLLAAVFALRGRIQNVILAGVAGAVTFAVITPFAVFPKIETALTDSNLPTIISETDYDHEPILCNSLYARGVYLYSGNPVVVMAGSKDPFWSKHPVTVVSEDQEIADFANARDTLLCVFTRGNFERFHNLTIADRRDTVLSQNLDRLVILSIKKQQVHQSESEPIGER